MLARLYIYGFTNHHILILFGLFHCELGALSAFSNFLEMADLVSYIIFGLHHNTITTNNSIKLGSLHQIETNCLPSPLIGHLVLVKLVGRMRDSFASVGPVAVVSAATGFSIGRILKIFGGNHRVFIAILECSLVPCIHKGRWFKVESG